MRNFILILLTFSVLSANEFRDIRKISLKKDEIKKIVVKYDGFEKLFKFRWTLYKNNALVVFHSYDQIVAQNILYSRYKNRSFVVELKPKGRDFYNVPYLLVKFKEFDSRKKEAVFELFLSDEMEQIVLKYLKTH